MRKHVMTGLAVLLPLALTFWIVFFLIGWFTEPFVGVAEGMLGAIGLKGVPILFLSANGVLFVLSRLLVLLFLFSFILLVGVVGRHVFVRYLIRFGDSLLHRIPVIRSVYKTSQELIQTIFSSDTRAFKQVVLVPFPRDGSLAIGLVAREGPENSERVPVFVPTAPNPTSGYLVLYTHEQLIPLKMSIEEAFRYIVSAGALIPNPDALEELMAPTIGGEV